MEKIKIEISTKIEECGDGCCQWSWTEAYVVFPNGEQSELRRIANYAIWDEQEAQEVALDFFDLNRDKVEFV